MTKKTTRSCVRADRKGRIVLGREKVRAKAQRQKGAWKVWGLFRWPLLNDNPPWSPEGSAHWSLAPSFSGGDRVMRTTYYCARCCAVSHDNASSWTRCFSRRLLMWREGPYQSWTRGLAALPCGLSTWLLGPPPTWRPSSWREEVEAARPFEGKAQNWHSVKSTVFCST